MYHLVPNLVQRAEALVDGQSAHQPKYTIKDGGAELRHRYDDLNLVLDGTSACAYNKHNAVLFFT